MAHPDGIHWTNKSVARLAQGDDPIAVIERKARELVLRARDAGWEGPPFNPLAIADLLNIRVEANADVPDACTIPTDGGVKIQFNPTQVRERVRFSLAHEIAHTLFPDVADKVRHRGGHDVGDDDWQLEMLCNIAASEFVMPIGSLAARTYVPGIGDLMVERRKFDVSAEAFLIRVAKVASEPIIMFCASPVADDDGLKSYRIDYAVPSQSAPNFHISGKLVPRNSVVFSCTAIGYTDERVERWFGRDALTIECVGIPGYPGARYPRVAGLIRFSPDQAKVEPLKVVHGDVLDPRGSGVRIVCQLVNDQARSWGGGVAKSTARKFPDAQRRFSSWITSLSRSERLGKVHFCEVGSSIIIASLVAQHGYGASLVPRIRYSALERCLEHVAESASEQSATVHMPRLGAGQSGGAWNTVEEIVRDTLLAAHISVTVYDFPPTRMSGSTGLFE